MGVPAFFRWLSKKYPSIVVHCVEEKPKQDIDGSQVPVDSSQPNPNDCEFDNLYLDMNGIIHPCSHPENKPAPRNEAEMMVNIFEYIDRIFSICRPRRLLYMAIDGVAPRAKMNQQRSRRFRAAKEGIESREMIAKIKKELLEKGALLPKEEEKKEGHFDSNCITPGTEFMDRLSVCLRYYITDRLTNDPGWKNIKVILSDANVPGEGEHKIVDYIRRQRSQPDHDPNTKHCLNGADADLIMLGLATHEAHFTIIREEFKPNQPKPCPICSQAGHELEECEGLPKEKFEEYMNDKIEPFVGADVEFIFIRLTVLREYLERELKMEGIPFGYDFERALDDWVFLCFFVGNDFLPHLPSLEIREGGIDKLVNIYKQCLPRMGGYLSESGHCNLKRVQTILQQLGELEDEIFRKRQEFEERMKRRRVEQKDRENREKRRKMEGQDSPGWSPKGFSSPLGAGHSPSPGQSPREYYQNQRNMNVDKKPDLRNFLLTPTPDGNPNSPNTPVGWNSNQRGVKRSNTEAFTTPTTPVKIKEEPEEPVDDIRLYEAGWKGRYYLHKFGVSEDKDPIYFQSFQTQVSNEYVLGLAWVLLYYFQGCPSWKWFYPFHYAPFASDFLDIERVHTKFEKGTQPFKPLEQLMSVFPSASGKFLPPTWREKMSSPTSEIIDFYPLNFKLDLNGKRYAWQGVALLPFVDEKRLHRTLAILYNDITPDERRRNRRDQGLLFVGKGNKMYDYLVGLHETNMLSEKRDIVTDFSIGMRGKIYADEKLVVPGSVYPCPVPNRPGLSTTGSFSVRYLDPEYDENFVFPAKPLKGVDPPERVLKATDFPQGRNYRPNIGMSNRNSHSPWNVSPGGQRMIRHGIGYQQNSFNNSPSPQHNNSGQRSSFSGTSDSRNSSSSILKTPQSLMGSPSPFQPYNSGNRNSPSSFNHSSPYGQRQSSSFSSSPQNFNQGGNQRHSGGSYNFNQGGNQRNSGGGMYNFNQGNNQQRNPSQQSGNNSFNQGSNQQQNSGDDRRRSYPGSQQYRR